MDILKVLSRGTKKAPKSTAGSAPYSSNLPSANRPNPQLFHDDVGSRPGGKRKRQDDGLDTPSDVEMSDLDFFAAHGRAKVDEPVKPTPKKAKLRTSSTKRRAKLLGEEECRQLLRSHRLKLTMLPTGQEKASKVKKSKKKKASLKVEAKEDKQQVYPIPLTCFAELQDVYSISPRLAENLARLHYRIPTEVQMASLPLLLDPKISLRNAAEAKKGVDFMAVAPTGSGKTLSFLVPAINDIMRRRAREKESKQHELEVIVLAPTRELAKQIANEGKKLAVGTGVRVVAMKKGMRVMATDGGTEDGLLFESEDEEGSSDDEEGQDAPSSDNDDTTSRRKKTSGTTTKAEILVTTPMILLNFLNEGLPKSRRLLPTVRSLVLDEADVLLDPMFRDQTLSIWSACTSTRLGVSFWSATMASNVESLAREQIRAHSERNDTRSRPLVRLVVGLKDSAVPNITHRLIYTATEPGKLLALRQLLHPASARDAGPALRPPFLVFTQTIERATALHDELKYDIPLPAGGTSRVAVLHSSLSDGARSGIMRRFRAGEIWVLITTDVLSRGVDFAGVNGVVNYDVPGSAAAYVHRAGRTGRAGREGGVAVTLYTKDDIPFVKSVANVIAVSEKQAGKMAGKTSDGVQKWLLDALPDVAKADRKKLKERGVESRRAGAKAKITSKSSWERRKENNRRGAIMGSKRRKLLQEGRRGGGEGSGSGSENVD